MFHMFLTILRGGESNEKISCAVVGDSGDL